MKQDAEYIIVSDTNSKVLRSFDNYKEANTFIAMLKQCGAQVTMFKSLQGKKTK